MWILKGFVCGQHVPPCSTPSERQTGGEIICRQARGKSTGYQGV